MSPSNKSSVDYVKITVRGGKGGDDCKSGDGWLENEIVHLAPLCGR